MPETMLENNKLTQMSLYGYYELVMPFIICLGICIPTTLIIKQKKNYQNMVE
jgi:hypothetical protein